MPEVKAEGSVASVQIPAADSSSLKGFAAATAGIQPFSYSQPNIQPAVIDAFDGTVTETMDVPQDKVAILIGSKGSIIVDLQAKSQCHMFVKQDMADGLPRQLIMKGTPTAVAMARALAQKVIDEGPLALLSGGAQLYTHQIDCPQALVGRVIGAGGATIRDLQARSGARIRVEQDFPDGYPRKVVITGTPETIQAASNLVTLVMEHGPIALAQMLAGSAMALSSFCVLSNALLLKRWRPSHS
jgi:rRNA processing protein Krr1/Pno1